MSTLSSDDKDEIIRRRHCISDGDGKKHQIDNLVIHHKDRDPENNDPRNLRVLTPKEHRDLHSKYG